MFNPDDDTHGDELDYFYDHFAKKTAIPDSNCLVLAFNRDETNNGNVKLCEHFWHKYRSSDHLVSSLGQGRQLS